MIKSKRKSEKKSINRNIKYLWIFLDLTPKCTYSSFTQLSTLSYLKKCKIRCYSIFRLISVVVPFYCFTYKQFDALTVSRRDSDCQPVARLWFPNRRSLLLRIAHGWPDFYSSVFQYVTGLSRKLLRRSEIESRRLKPMYDFYQFTSSIIL